jgi:hypothetical protein
MAASSIRERLGIGLKGQLRPDLDLDHQRHLPLRGLGELTASRSPIASLYGP